MLQPKLTNLTPNALLIPATKDTTIVLDGVSNTPWEGKIWGVRPSVAKCCCHLC